MKDEYFYNADAEIACGPEEGSLRFWTEFGIYRISSPAKFR